MTRARLLPVIQHLAGIGLRLRPAEREGDRCPAEVAGPDNEGSVVNASQPTVIALGLERPAGDGNPAAGLDIGTCRGGGPMPEEACPVYSGKPQHEQSENSAAPPAPWRSVGDVARKIVEQAKRGRP